MVCDEDDDGELLLLEVEDDLLLPDGLLVEMVASLLV